MSASKTDSKHSTANASSDNGQSVNTWLKWVRVRAAWEYDIMELDECRNWDDELIPLFKKLYPGRDPLFTKGEPTMSGDAPTPPALKKEDYPSIRLFIKAARDDDVNDDAIKELEEYCRLCMHATRVLLCVGVCMYI